MADDELLDSILVMRVRGSKKLRIKIDAEKAGVSMSELVRRKCVNVQPILSDTDKERIDELKRIGGRLKYLHDESNGSYSQDMADGLSELRAFLSKLRDLIKE